MSNKAIPWREVDVEKISLGDTKVEEKSKTVSYYTTPILYNYGTEEEPRNARLKYESPVFTARKGIGKMVDEKNPGKEPNYTLYVGIDLDDPEHAEFYAKKLEIHTKLKNLCVGNVKLVNAKFLPDENPTDGYESPFKYPKDKETKIPDYTKHPSLSVKLSRVYKEDPKTKVKRLVYETKFVDPRMNKLSWDFLEEKAFKCIIVIEDQTLYRSMKKTDPVYEQQYADSVMVVEFLKDTTTSFSSAAMDTAKQKYAAQYVKSKQDIDESAGDLSAQLAASSLGNPLDLMNIPETPAESFDTEEPTE